MQRPILQLSNEMNDVLHLLEHTCRSVFVTGRAGTGKSTLLQLFRRTTRKRMAVLAPTGVAALNVQGQTIHSFFELPPRVVTPGEMSRKTLRPDVRALCKILEVLVLDEISMVRADVLDAIDQLLRSTRNSHEPFGGVQMVFFGDLFQLPPVVESDAVVQSYFSHEYESPYFFSAKIMDFTASNFQFEGFELGKVYRQESHHFLSLLEAVRRGELDEWILEDLNYRYLPHFQTDPDAGFITLCTRNDIAERINQKELARIEGAAFSYRAEIIDTFDPKLYPTEVNLTLKVGAQVMFIKNDPNRQFVNGSIGKVVRLSATGIEVQLMNEAEDAPTVVSVPKMEWEMLRYTMGQEREIKTQVIGIFRQYPLKLAWAITIHKSQGKTFDRVIIDLGGGAFEHGQLYVALSRCRTLEGIVLRQPVRQSDAIMDTRVADFYQRFFL